MRTQFSCDARSQHDDGDRNRYGDKRVRMDRTAAPILATAQQAAIEVERPKPVCDSKQQHPQREVADDASKHGEPSGHATPPHEFTKSSGYKPLSAPPDHPVVGSG
jgi:hypothetical protein